MDGFPLFAADQWPSRPALANASTGTSSWTAEREARACRLYLEEGFSASEVAQALGCGLSRGAVIGKIKRLGFSKRQPPAQRIDTVRLIADRPNHRLDCGPPPRQTRRLPPSWPPQPLPPLREAPLQGPPALLADLAETACHWPIDDPGPARMHATMFCAAPSSAGAYCPAHRALAAALPKNAAEAQPSAQLGTA